MIDTIIFDAEGVVVDSEHLWDIGQQKFLGDRGLVYDREKVKHVIGGMSIIDIVKILQNMYGFDGNPEELKNEHINNMRGLFKHGLDFVRGFEDFYFKKIKGRYKTAIGTSMYTELMEVANEKLKLYDIFDCNVFTIAEVGFASKPNPDIFLYAARKLNSQPDSCLVIEDAPNGIEAARRAGMRCVALTTTYSREKLLNADLVVDSYSQIDLSRF